MDTEQALMDARDLDDQGQAPRFAIPEYVRLIFC